MKNLFDGEVKKDFIKGLYEEDEIVYDKKSILKVCSEEVILVGVATIIPIWHFLFNMFPDKDIYNIIYIFAVIVPTFAIFLPKMKLSNLLAYQNLVNAILTFSVLMAMVNNSKLLVLSSFFFLLSIVNSTLIVYNFKSGLYVKFLMKTSRILNNDYELDEVEVPYLKRGTVANKRFYELLTRLFPGELNNFYKREMDYMVPELRKVLSYISTRDYMEFCEEEDN